MSEGYRFGGQGSTGSGSTDDGGFFISGPPRRAAEAPAPPQGQFAPPAGLYAAPAPVGALPPPVGAPVAYGYPPYQPAPPHGGLPVWAIVLIFVPACLIVVGILAAIAIPVFLNQRDIPVTPEQLGGLSRTTDPQMTSTVTGIHDGVVRENPSARITAAGYGTFSDGYQMLGMRGTLDTEQLLRTLGVSGPLQHVGEAVCGTTAGREATICVRTSTRGSVEVATFSAADLAQLAAVTEEAWRAQPFG